MELIKFGCIALLLLATQAASAQIYKWTDENGGVHFSDGQRPEQFQGQPAKVTEAPQNTAATKNGLNARKDMNGSTSESQPYSKNIKLTVRKLLSERKFSELNKQLENYLVATQKDMSNERDLMTSYWAFEVNDDSLPQLFNDWIKASPKSYQPYLASAFYYNEQAWEARGGKWSSETKQEQFAKMNDYFGKVAVNLDEVLKKNNRALPAYFVLIGMIKTSGDIKAVSKVFNVAMKIYPDSYYLRKAYLWSARPRWGGSYELMQQVIDEAQSHVDNNPRLKLLKGEIYADVADMKTFDRAYNEADRLYATELGYGDNEVAYWKRGVNNCRRKHYQEALADLDKAIAIYAEDSDYFYWRATAHINLSEDVQAADDIMKADLLKPGDEDIETRRKWIASKMLEKGHDQYEKRQLDSSIGTMNRALELDANNPYIYYERSRVYAEKSDLDSAEQDLQKSIEIDPNNYDFVKMMDYVLSRKRDWDHIIAYWSDYIKRNPDDGRAYVERGGAYYHKGDLKTAVLDAKTSADLGNPEGKAAYEKFGPLVK